MENNSWRPYKTQYECVVECTKNLWLVIHDSVQQQVGVVPIVAWGREDRGTEYASTHRWRPLVCHEWALVDAESIPGALGVVVGVGGGPPGEEALRDMVEDVDEQG